MVRVLRNLKITEVSGVDKGAGDGCRVVLFKRDTPDNGDLEAPSKISPDNIDDEAYAAALHFLTRTAHGAAVMRRLFPTGVNSPADIEHLAQMVARIMRNSDDAEPSDMHQPWADTIDDTTDTEKKVHMDRDTELQAIVKRDGNVVQLCKRICKEGSGGISESELTSLITEYAQQLYPDMSPEIAFSKAYLSAAAEPLRRAIQIAKGMLQPVQPVQVGGGDSDGDDAAKAYGHLERLAEATRKRLPGLSASQAFERAAKERPDLLARAVPRR
jgi:hypothetical protein